MNKTIKDQRNNKRKSESQRERERSPATMELGMIRKGLVISRGDL